jgi:hypothetical protein
MKSQRRLFWAIMILTSSGCATPHVNFVPPGTRPPNDNELFYTTVASAFSDPKMCEKISRKAINESCGPDIACTQWTVEYQKSICYLVLASKTKRAEFCNSVERVTVIPSNHSSISQSSCLASIQPGNSYGFVPFVDEHTVADMMSQMGYRGEDLLAVQYSDNPINNPLREFFDTIKGTPSFRSKIEGLPDQDERPANEALRAPTHEELLAQMLAIDEDLPRLCHKVSPNAHSEYLGSRGVADIFLRNDCFYALAYNDISLQLCANISIKGPFNRQSCEESVRMKMAHEAQSRAVYGPQSFSTAAEFVKALRSFGYDPPLQSTKHPFGWEDFYQHLEFHPQEGEKQEFLRRAEALPSFSK